MLKMALRLLPIFLLAACSTTPSNHEKQLVYVIPEGSKIYIPSDVEINGNLRVSGSIFQGSLLKGDNIEKVE